MRSIPGPLPASDFWRIAAVAPSVVIAFLGLRFLSVPNWISMICFLVIATLGVLAWLQLGLELRPASNDQMSSSRAYNHLAGIALMLIIVVGWML